MMGLTKQAAYLSESDVKKAIARASSLRHGKRNRLILLLGIYAGLRAKEISGLKWLNVLDSERNINDVITLTNDISKGKSGGTIPISAILKDALGQQFADWRRKNKYKQLDYRSHIIGLKTQSIINLTREIFGDCDILGGSSHSMRRTFITNVARKIGEVGGSMNDVRELSRHQNLQTTQRYIARNSAAQKSVVDLL